MKRIISLVVVLTMSFGVLAACNANPPASDAGATGTNAGATDTSNGTTDAVTDTSADTGGLSEHMKFTMSVIDAEKAGKMDDDGSLAGDLAWLYEKFNFEFEFYPLTWENRIDQTRLWLAGNDAPDIMMLDISGASYTEFLQNVEEGLFKPYTELEKYPNLKEKLDKSTAGKKFIVDGELYAWPAFLDSDKYDFRSVSGFTYRIDWAKAVGLYKESGIYTWDEWKNLIKTVIEEDPGNNGAGRTIGLIGFDWTFPDFFGGANVGPNLTGGYTKDAAGKYVWGPSMPESLEALKLVKELYDEGLIWSDQFMAKNEDMQNKFHSGQLFGMITFSDMVDGKADYVKKFKLANPDLDPAECIDFGFFQGPNGKILSLQAKDHWSQEAMNASLSDEKADRWKTILDYLVSEEGYYFRNLGIPGQDWEMVDGIATAKWTTTYEDGSLKKPYDNTWSWSRAADCSDGFELISPNYDKRHQDRLRSEFDVIMDDSAIKLIPFDVELSYFTGEQLSAVGDLNVEVRQKIIELVFSDNKNIEDEWNAWIESKLPIVQPVVDELNENLN